jgi:hypothetical protein
MPTNALPNDPANAEGATECLSDELLFRYLEGSVTKREASHVQRHLDSCAACFSLAAALARQALHPPDEVTLLEFEKTIKLNPDDQVARILAHVEEQGLTTREEPDSSSETGFGQILRSWLDALTRRPAFAFSGLALGIIAAFFFYQKVIKTDHGRYYVYDQSVPYEYDISSLRAPATGTEQDSLFSAFARQFKLGMSDYMLRDYESTINTLEKAEFAILALQTDLSNEKILPWIRDFYFYLGASHFALSRSRELDLSPVVRTQHANESIRWLALADSLAVARQLEASDRESYFLGLAYGFAGRRQPAVEQLKKLSQESDYYKEANKLIQEWSKE